MLRVSWKGASAGLQVIVQDRGKPIKTGGQSHVELNKDPGEIMPEEQEFPSKQLSPAVPGRTAFPSVCHPRYCSNGAESVADVSWVSLAVM